MRTWTLFGLWKRRDIPQDLVPFWRRFDSRDTPPPQWRDSRKRVLRSYTFLDFELEVDDSHLRVKVRSHKRFVRVFGTLFIPAFVLVCWFFIPGESRLHFTVLALLCSIGAMGLIVGFVEHHESLGDYLEVNREAGTVRLPRLQLEFMSNDVVGWQWIEGLSEHHFDVQSDLNILVAESSGLARYHVMGEPSHALVEEIVRFSKLPLDEIRLGRKGRRDLDCRTSTGGSPNRPAPEPPPLQRRS